MKERRGRGKERWRGRGEVSKEGGDGCWLASWVKFCLKPAFLHSSSSFYQLHKPVRADALTPAPEKAMQRLKETETGRERRQPIGPQ